MASDYGVAALIYHIPKMTAEKIAIMRGAATKRKKTTAKKPAYTPTSSTCFSITIPREWQEGYCLPTTKNTAHHIIIIVKLPATHSLKQWSLCFHSCRSQIYVTAQYRATKAVDNRASTAKPMATVRVGTSAAENIRLSN